MGKTSIMPNLVTIKATRVAAPPTWALLERQLISLMEKGARMMSGKYAERSGAWYWSDDLDDYYERSHNWCLLYNMGGDESLVDLALKHWQRRYGGHGWRHMPETIAQLMRYKGFEKELIEAIFVTNAATILTKA